MASTYANAHTAWRVRTDGNELNGGGFDSSVTNAGTDYTDQASPQVSSTTGTCTVGSTTWTDSGATFTAAMIGNVLRISAKTGGDATALDYFVITGYTNATNITLDRSPCAVANITAATYRIGGAHASLASYATSATVLPTPTLATPLIAGNRIYIRGSGSLDPSAADYDYSAGKWVFPSGTRVAGSAGVITLIGYNGRPRIDHCGSLITAHWDCKHVSWFRKLNTNAKPVFIGASDSVNNTTTDCIIDQNGFDVTEWYGQNGGFLYNEVRNSGGGAAGSAQVVAVQHPSNAVIGNYIHGVRGPAISVQWSAALCTTFVSMCYNTIVNNLSDGIQINATAGAGIAYGYSVFNNTINNNGGHGINVSTGNLALLTCFNNIISNHTGSGKYGINFADTLTTNRRIQRNPFDANCFYGNTTDWSNWAYQTNDIQLDPQYSNAASGNYATGANVRSKGLSGLGGVAGTLGTATNLVNIGAWQGAPESSSTTISCDVGDAVANGLQATISQSIIVNCLIGNANAEGKLCAVEGEEVLQSVGGGGIGYGYGYATKKRNVQEERERLGIIPKVAKKEIKRIASKNVAYKLEGKAQKELKASLENKGLEFKSTYKDELAKEIERRINKNLYGLLSRQKEAEDRDDEEAASWLLF